MDASPLLAAAAGFALLLGTAAWRKLGALEAFAALAEDYRLLPRWLLAPAALVIALAEAVLALLWLAAPWFRDAAWLAGTGTAALMLVYASAMAINLLRGRAWIDCGCGAGESLSWMHVMRNALFAALAVTPLALPASGWGWTDAAFAALLLGVAAALHLASNALLGNAAADPGRGRAVRGLQASER